MKNIMKHSLLLAVVMALTGCGPTLTPKEPHVALVSVSHPVAFEVVISTVTPATPGCGTKLSPAGTYYRLTNAERDSLAAFVNTFPANAVQSVSLATKDMSAPSLEQARSIRNYLVARGVDKNVIGVQPAQGIGAQTVVATVTYAKSIPPAPCPDWSANASVDYNSAGSSNFGCAAGNNFIMQLEDPADYNGGHGQLVSSGARDSVTLQKYLGGAAPAGGAGGGGSAGGGSTTTTTSSP